MARSIEDEPEVFQPGGNGTDEPAPDDEAAGDVTMLSGDAFADYTWSIFRQRTRAEQSDGGQPWEYWCRKTGPIDLEQLQSEVGGGTFELRGYRKLGTGSGRRGLKKRVTVTLRGDRQQSESPSSPTPTPPTAPTTTSSSDPIVRLIERMDERMDRMQEAVLMLARGSSSQSTGSIRDIAEVMKVLNEIRQPAARDPDLEVVKTLMGVFQQGISMGQQREPAPIGDGPDWNGIVNTAAPIFNKVVDVFVESRKRQTIRRAVPPTTPSRAEVVGDPEPAETVAPEPDMRQVRMMALMDALARAIERRLDPADFADTVADSLPADELAPFLTNPPELVVAEIARVGIRYPAIATDAGKAYIGAVLQALRSGGEVTDDDAEDTTEE